MTFERVKVAAWERYTDGEWHEVRRGPQGESRAESERQYRRHYQSMRAWCDINKMRGQLSRSDHGRVLKVRIKSDQHEPSRERIVAAIKDRTRYDIGRALIDAVQILEYGFHLRVHGENAPGGNETWREFDRRTEDFLRQLMPEQE